MHIFKTIQEVRDYRRDLPSTFRVGFVPTMGCLHMGHASLMKQARAECSKVIVSIYVNPTQFAANEDFTVYPRTWEEDRCVCEAEGVDAIFLPSHSEMYPRGHEKQRYYCEVEGAVEQAEGRSRPHHFRAVATVCLKLFNIVLPSDVYFGQKDAMQCAVIRSMIVELNVPVIFHVGDTVRESDGLALSSRNKYLSPSERRDVAPYLYKALLAGKESVMTGEKPPQSSYARPQGKY